MLWTSAEKRVLIRINQQEFDLFCNFTAPASRHSTVLSHESRAFLFLYRIAHNTSKEVLGALFRVSPNTAMRAYNDMLFFLLMNDSYIPSMWNRANVTEQELQGFLIQLRNIQSAGIR